MIVGKYIREIRFVVYDPLHTAEYATPFWLFDWLYFLWHGINDDIHFISYNILETIRNILCLIYDTPKIT